MSRQARLGVVLLLNLVLVAALLIVGIAAHSLAVFAEGGDYLLDAAAVGVALFAIYVSGRSDGPHNASNIAALVNAGWLLVLEVLVAAAAVYRLAGGVPEVRGLPVLIVSAIAAVVMTIGAVILGGDADHDGDDLSMRAVLLDTVADAAAAGGVAVVGAVILVTHGWYWLDPAVALVIAVVISGHAVSLLLQVRRRMSTEPTRPSL